MHTFAQFRLFCSQRRCTLRLGLKGPKDAIGKGLGRQRIDKLPVPVRALFQPAASHADAQTPSQRGEGLKSMYAGFHRKALNEG